MKNQKIITIKEIKNGIMKVINNQPKYQDVKKIVLFGSYANNTATSKSDINICMIDQPDYDVLKQYSFEASLEEYFNKPVHILNLNDAYDVNRSLYDTVIKEGLTIYVKQNAYNEKV